MGLAQSRRLSAEIKMSRAAPPRPAARRIINTMTFGLSLARLAVLTLVGAAEYVQPATRSESAVRRVCVLDGLETYAAPNSNARVRRSTATAPSRLGAGTYVTVTTDSSNGYRRITQLDGTSRWVRETTPQGRATLCVPPSIDDSQSL